MNRKTRRLAWGIASLLVLAFFTEVIPGRGQFTQPAERILEEAQAVYLGNLARRANGVPPLRWNLPMTLAARWFSWDSVVNRPGGYCGHQDTQGNWPDYRTHYWGYRGWSGAENAFCGYVSSQAAIDGWMNSPGHRANLLDPASREVGLGYYVRPNDGRGYVTQDFGIDAVYPPVIIENEALQTSSTQVNLYIYDRSPGGGFAEMGPANEMLISNNRCFTGASWEPYQAEKPWSLAAGQGWRTVYVKTRDVLMRTSTVSDMIYLGVNLPIEELGEAQMSTNQSAVTLYSLDGGAFSNVQFSMGWRVDNTYGTFGGLWGNGQSVSDAQAWGGTAFRMMDGAGESSAWVWTTEFIKDTPMVAYMRMKVSNNTTTSEVARISATGGETIRLRGVDFQAPNVYQEFPIAFNFPASETFLTFQFWRSGTADVTVDAVTIFTAPQAITSPLTWTVPGGNFRGQGIWLRYTNGAGQFSAIEEATLTPQGLEVAPTELNFNGGIAGAPPAPLMVQVAPLGCAPISWNVATNTTWIETQKNGNLLAVAVDTSGLSAGTYSGSLTIQPDDLGNGPPVQIPVNLSLYPQYFILPLPIILGN